MQNIYSLLIFEPAGEVLPYIGYGDAPRESVPGGGGPSAQG